MIQAITKGVFVGHEHLAVLPSRIIENRIAGGFSEVRPVTTHNRLIYDFRSCRGLFVIS